MIPDRVAGTIIFDAPVGTEDRNRFDTDAFYEDEASWQRDLPLHSVNDFQAVMPESHSLVLISGEVFHTEMSALSKMMDEAGLTHAFLPRPGLKHHWNSGWIEEGLAELLE